jgi:hypothetical protein
MKPYRSSNLLLGIFILVLTLTGCTTVPADPTPKQQTIANAVEDVIAVGLVPVLAKNPAYATEAGTVAGLLGSFAGTEVTGAGIEALLAKVKLAPEDAKLVAALVNAAWDTYQRRYAEQVGKAIRPDVKLFLAAVANGIQRAVIAVPR